MLLLIMSKAASHLIDIANKWPIIVMKVYLINLALSLKLDVVTYSELEVLSNAE